MAPFLCPVRATSPGSARPSPREGAFAPSRTDHSSEADQTINRIDPPFQRAHPGSGAALRDQELVWMPPVLQVDLPCSEIEIECVLVSGLIVRPFTRRWPVWRSAGRVQIWRASAWLCVLDWFS